MVMAPGRGHSITQAVFEGFGGESDLGVVAGNGLAGLPVDEFGFLLGAEGLGFPAAGAEPAPRWCRDAPAGDTPG